ncbi:MAG: hypothetical protein ACK4IZ_03270 [Flavobacterium sp.]|uniref:hypothetical protein n=1 Tax=Flavobacterium sp. TaxID=239 RepID=UPI00391945A3
MTTEQIERINKMLYRPLKDGKNYESVIPKPKNLVFKFDKPTDNNDTFKTLDFMVQWKEKYASQCAKLAKLLEGKTKAETCRNTYNFLYNHFQYKLDGEAQNLRALSQAWENRFKGMDCKSFSLLAAMILENLKIDCAFRMVKIGSNAWVHVYVVVPDGKSYHVIDATTHDNKEVKFTQKHDKNMYHLGLASPIPTGLSCSCKGQPIKVTGLGNPDTLANSIRNFHAFLNQLESRGVSRNITNTMLQIVKENVQKGIDPNMLEVFQMAVALNRKQGLGLSIMGIDGTTAVSAYMGDPAAIKTVISKIIPESFISSTFGAVFANGLDFSCWGASLTPQTAANNVKKYHTPHFNYRLNAIQSASNQAQLQDAINIFIKDVYSLHQYYTVYKPKAASWSNCAKKGIKLYVDFMTKLKAKADQIVADTTAKGATVKTIKDSPLGFWFRSQTTGVPDKDEMRNNPSTSFVEYPQITLQAFVAPTNTTQNLVFTPNSDGTITVKDTNTGESAVITKEQAIANGYKPKSLKNESSGSGVLLTTAAASAALFFFWPKGNPQKSVPQNRTKKKVKTNK